ncbi:unnamed protein product [Ranitomeya imitator]|uniref:DUF1279 domain-containing protein n=1 Tax=Ranitomeya imitator TaxID=111125 RepID=A0ABN9ML84_9NEOB|nr:unnamed protein product [Ranitomeya imitator]
MLVVQSAVSKIGTKYKQHGKVVKGKHTGRPRKTSKRQDRKLQAMSPKQEMHNKTNEKRMGGNWSQQSKWIKGSETLICFIQRGLDVSMHLLRTLFLRCNSRIISVSTLTLRAHRPQTCLISPRIGGQVLIFHGQNQWFHSAPRLDSSQDKGDHQIPSLHTGNSEKSKDTSSVTDAPVPIDDTDPLQDKSIGLVQRFKKTFRQYGKVMVTVHVLTSSVWLGTFYYAAVKGINVVPFLEWVGLPESIVNILKNSESGNVLTAYALYKFPALDSAQLPDMTN